MTIPSSLPSYYYYYIPLPDSIVLFLSFFPSLFESFLSLGRGKLIYCPLFFLSIRAIAEVPQNLKVDFGIHNGHMYTLRHFVRQSKHDSEKEELQQQLSRRRRELASYKL